MSLNFIAPGPSVTQILFGGLGGHASVAFSLIEASKKKSNWNNSLIFFGAENLHAEYRQRCESANLPFAEIKSAEGKSWLSWPALLRALHQRCPDIVILHSTPLILPSYIHCRLRGIPLLTVEHTPNQVKSRPEWMASAFTQLLASKVVLLTADYRHELSMRLGGIYKDRKTYIIPNGIDTEVYSNKPSNASQNLFRIGMAARFSKTKDQNLLIKAVAKLNRAKTRKVRLILAGSGQTLQAAKDLATRLGLDTENVEFVGALNEEQLRTFYSQLDLYVHSSFGETMSTSIMQALASGLPVLASDIPGIRNLLGPEHGVLAPHTVDGFCQEIERLQEFPDECERLGIEARKFAQQCLSNYRMFTQYASLF